MAPNRKKKKAASNPARGFATTSIASKPKEVHVTEEAEAAVLTQDEQLGKADSVVSKSIAVDSTSKELHELSPEELEIQLEESDLQLLVEKQGEKSKKDASRQIARLQTERRVLRTQAVPLSTHRWLPPELMLQITDQLGAQMASGGLYVEFDNKAKPQSIPEDDLSVRLWTLGQVLVKLGFSEARAHEAISQLLQNEQLAKHATLAQAKDFIWGLEECLDWLGLVCEPVEMLDYDASRHDAHQRQLRGVGLSVQTPDAGEPLVCSFALRVALSQHFAKHLLGNGLGLINSRYSAYNTRGFWIIDTNLRNPNSATGACEWCGSFGYEHHF